RGLLGGSHWLGRAVVGFVLAAALRAPAPPHPLSLHVALPISLAFRIGHGCEGQPTTSVSIQIPGGVASVQPFPKAGWDLDVETGPLPEPIDAGDRQITEGVTNVTWSGGSLEDAHTDVFQIRATIYGDEGDAVFFPVVQRCGDTEHAWIAIPAEGHDPHDLEEPAPGLTIAVEADDDDEDSSGPNVFAIVALALAASSMAMSAAALASSRNGDKAGD